MVLQKIKNVESFARDNETSAIVATDTVSLDAYKKGKQRQKQYDTALADINNLKSELNEIKVLLKQFLT